MHIQLLATLLSAALLAAPSIANAQSTPASAPQPANEQVIVPQVDRRELTIPKIPSRDFEFGLFAGSYQTESLGSAPVYGLRVGYHITEDFFVEATYGQTKVSEDNLKPLLLGGTVLADGNKLIYYNLSFGYNIFPGEIFFSRNYARPSAFYIIAGAGNTELSKRDSLTFNAGFGMRVWFTQRFSVQLDLRDHFFKSDLLGTEEMTQNLEWTLGATFFF
jgi:outer membrane beta-barrel protein